MARDILDDPKVTVPIWQSHDYYRMIEKYYDQVWIFGSPELFDAAEAYQMPEGVLQKLSIPVTCLSVASKIK
ncbi:MAG: hypothetical protein R3C26_12810 [Calditrichia bacterium]